MYMCVYYLDNIITIKDFKKYSADNLLSLPSKQIQNLNMSPTSTCTKMEPPSSGTRITDLLS